MEKLYLSTSLYKENILKKAIKEYNKIAKINIVKRDKEFVLEFNIISNDNIENIIDEFCNYVLSLMNLGVYNG